MAKRISNNLKRAMEINGDADVLNATPGDVLKAHLDLSAEESKMKERQGNMAGIKKNFDDQKINKDAFNIVHKLKKMDANRRDDTVRALMLYMSPEYLDCLPQPDLVDMAGQTAANATTVADAGTTDDRLRTAKAQGYQAGHDGLDITLCPYSARSQEAEKMAWANEWRRAQGDRLQETFGAKGDGTTDDDGEAGGQEPKGGDPVVPEGGAESEDDGEPAAEAQTEPTKPKRDRRPKATRSLAAQEGAQVH